jgi:hypothetical protein
MKPPLDPQLLLAAADAWRAEKNLKQATLLLGQALKLEPRSGEDERARRISFEAAQQRQSSNAAFSLLEAQMGARGADVLWDLAADERAPLWTRQRAGSWLRSSHFRKVASEALLLAADLRTAKSCEAALELLPKAKAIGDARSLPQLEAWTKTAGCGPSRKDDCMACLRGGSALAEAISAISTRQRAP